MTFQIKLTRHLNIYFVFLLLFYSLPNQSYAEVILHAFNWPYKVVTERANEISSLGYAAVLVSPPLKSSGYEWWARYQPQDYRVIDHPLGTKETFIDMVAALSKTNVKTYADVVLNHMAGGEFKETLLYPGKGILQEYTDRKSFFTKQKMYGNLSENIFTYKDFKQPSVQISNYDDPFEARNYQIGDLPDLNPTNNVIKHQRRYLFSLKHLGVKGFRIDAAKHISIDHLKLLFTEEITSDTTIFYEIITSKDPKKNTVENFLNPLMKEFPFSAYNFPLFYKLQKEFGLNGNLSNLLNKENPIMAIDDSRSVTFSIVHDFPNNEIFSQEILDIKDEFLIQSFLLGSGKGSHLIYSDMFFDDYSPESNTSYRWRDNYKKLYTKNMISFYNYCKGAKIIELESSTNYLAFRREGKGLVIINNSNNLVIREYPKSELHLNDDTKVLINTLDNEKMSINNSNEKLKFSVRPKSVEMWIF